MKTRQFGFAATVIGLGAITLSVACADQPNPKCVTGRGEFAARFTNAKGPAWCLERKGEVFGVQAYNASKDTNYPDLDKIPLAIQSVRLADFAGAGEGDTAAGHSLFATGIFKNGEPGSDGLCAVDMQTAALQDLTEVEATPAESEEDADTKVKTCSAPANPGVKKMSVKYEWSDVVFYVTASATGTQFKGHLKYTQDAEVCEWDVHAVYPSVSCGDPVGRSPDNTVTTTNDDTCRKTNKKDEMCRPDAANDLIYGNPVGSSINPDFPTSCEPFDDTLVHGQPTQFVCLPPIGKFPALR